MIRSEMIVVALIGVNTFAHLAQPQNHCYPNWTIAAQNLQCFSPCNLGGPTSANCPLCKDVTYRVTFPDQTVYLPNLAAGGAWNRYYNGCSETGTVFDPTNVYCWPTMVHRVWQRHHVQPHRVERFKLSNDPHFEAKVRDIVGLYLNRKCT
jgi:hypothetical protein